MSRGFVKEDDQEEPVFIPQRAPLPPGFDNLVTPRGLQNLQEERTGLEEARTKLDLPQGPERRRALAELNGRIALVEERIATAQVVDPGPGPDHEARFGSTVSFRIATGSQAGAERTFTLVGVDEARVAEGRIAFTAPIAQALLGAKAGKRVEFQLAGKVEILEVKKVS